MPTSKKTKAVAEGRARTPNRVSILDPKTGFYPYKPYKPDVKDIKYREYKYKSYERKYEDPLTKKTEEFTYRDYVSEAGHKRHDDYQLPKQDDRSFPKEKRAIQKIINEKTHHKSQPLQDAPAVVTNNTSDNDRIEFQRFGYQPLFSKSSVFQYLRFKPPLDW